MATDSKKKSARKATNPRSAKKATKTVPTAKSTKQPVTCWCGCGGLTAPRPASKQELPAYRPGHDAAAHASAKKVARGTLDNAAALAALPHNAARTEFANHVNVEKAKIAAAVKDAVKVAKKPKK